MGARLAAVAITTAALLWTSTTVATTRTVCASGCDYTTIGACYTASSPLDVCSITDAGTYNECVTSGSKNQVTFQGPSAASRPIVNCSGPNQNVFSGYYGNHYKNLIITGNNFNCVHESYGSAPPQAGSFTDVNISSCGGACVFHWDQTGYTGQFTMTRVVMQGCGSNGGGWPCLLTGGAATGNKPQLTNVVCNPHSTASLGIDLDSGACTHCTLVGSKGSIAAVKGAGGATVKHSIASGAGAKIQGNDCDYNISYGGTGFDCTSNTNSSTSDPALVSVYQIGAGSVAVDFAVGSTETLDVENQSRPSGTYADSGAYEYQQPPGATLQNRITGGALGKRVTGGTLGKRVD